MRGGEIIDWDHMPSLVAAAHELKSPLVLMRQLALEIEQAPTPQSAERLRLTAERSLRLVDSLTRSVRLGSGDVQSEPVNLNIFAEDVLHELEPLVRAMDQRIELVRPRRSLLAVADRELLRSLLIGLCDNALTHNRLDTPIIMKLSRQHDRIHSALRDHGPRSDQMRDIKRRLGRSPQLLSGRPRSSGLGLLIASQFASSMGGQIRLVRHRQSGMTALVELPESRQLALI